MEHSAFRRQPTFLVPARERWVGLTAAAIFGCLEGGVMIPRRHLEFSTTSGSSIPPRTSGPGWEVAARRCTQRTALLVSMAPRESPLPPTSPGDDMSPAVGQTLMA